MTDKLKEAREWDELVLHIMAGEINPLTDDEVEGLKLDIDLPKYSDTPGMYCYANGYNEAIDKIKKSYWIIKK